jgi:hypothetical protein
VDRTSFIVKFDEALIAPVSIAAINSGDEADPETVRAAAQQLGSAAATAAARIAELARQTGINMQVVDTYGECSMPAGYALDHTQQPFKKHITEPLSICLQHVPHKGCSCLLSLVMCATAFALACCRPCDDWHGSEGGNSRGGQPSGSAAQS